MRKYNYWNRLKKVCELRKLDVNAISKLVDAVRKRASGDRVVDKIFWGIIRELEPPGCIMSHCDQHTTYGFCNCYDELMPSRCKKHREFVQRQYDRMEKIYLEGRAFVKNAEKPIKFECPYDQHSKYVGIKDKYELFKQGAEDEYKNFPMRSMKTGKLSLEWGVPTDETIEEYLYFEDYDKARSTAKEFELSSFDIHNYYEWGNPDRRVGKVYFIAQATRGCGWCGNAKALKAPKPINEADGSA